MDWTQDPEYAKFALRRAEELERRRRETDRPSMGMPQPEQHFASDSALPIIGGLAGLASGVGPISTLAHGAAGYMGGHFLEHPSMEEGARGVLQGAGMAISGPAAPAVSAGIGALYDKLLDRPISPESVGLDVAFGLLPHAGKADAFLKGAFDDYGLSPQMRQLKALDAQGLIDPTKRLPLPENEEGPGDPFLPPPIPPPARPLSPAIAGWPTSPMPTPPPSLFEQAYADLARAYRDPLAVAQHHYAHPHPQEALVTAPDRGGAASAPAPDRAGGRPSPMVDIYEASPTAAFEGFAIDPVGWEADPTARPSSVAPAPARYGGPVQKGGVVPNLSFWPEPTKAPPGNTANVHAGIAQDLEEGPAKTSSGPAVEDHPAARVELDSGPRVGPGLAPPRPRPEIAAGAPRPPEKSERPRALDDWAYANPQLDPTKQHPGLQKYAARMPGWDNPGHTVEDLSNYFQGRDPFGYGFPNLDSLSPKWNWDSPGTDSMRARRVAQLKGEIPVPGPEKQAPYKRLIELDPTPESDPSLIGSPADPVLEKPYSRPIELDSLAEYLKKR